MRLYRIVRHDPPVLEDFESAASKGRPMPADFDASVLWDGVSMFDTVERARRKASALPVLGSFIAEVAVSQDRTLHVARPTRSRGHYTVWARPERLLRSVARVVEV